MAILIPTIEEILHNKIELKEKQLKLLNLLNKNLDNSHYIFFQPYLNGLCPDIVILKKGYGVFIIETADNIFNCYNESKNICDIKNPFEQVKTYKKNLYELYLYELSFQNMLDKRCYGFVKIGVYFHDTKKENLNMFFYKTKPIKHISVWGENSDIIYDINKSLNFKNKNVELEKSFNKLYNILLPKIHKADDGKIDNDFNRLSKSEIGLKTKIRGVAGCGKSTLLANKAINVVKRKNGNCRILILSFNITLINFLKDKISVIKEDFDWNNFNIIHYHGFLKQSNIKNIENIEKFNSKENKELLEKFKNKIPEKLKYDAILIDEGQDFSKKWFHLLKEIYLKDNGEFLIMADEKQSIYNRAELDNEKKILTNIPGKWNVLKKSQRLKGRFLNLAKDFQEEFFKDKYELDDLNHEQLELNVDEQNIKYVYNDFISYENIFLEVKNYLNINSIDYKDVCILSSEIKHLRKLHHLIKNNIDCEIMFETQEEFEELLKNYLRTNRIYFNSQNINYLANLYESKDNPFKEKLEIIRRIKKFNFHNNSKKLKLCTTHSFKGFECNTIVLILDFDDKYSSKELIYTAITRCSKNLIIYNRGKKEYDYFFQKICD